MRQSNMFSENRDNSFDQSPNYYQYPNAISETKVESRTLLPVQKDPDQCQAPTKMDSIALRKG